MIICAVDAICVMFFVSLCLRVVSFLLHVEFGIKYSIHHLIFFIVKCQKPFSKRSVTAAETSWRHGTSSSSAAAAASYLSSRWSHPQCQSPYGGDIIIDLDSDAGRGSDPEPVWAWPRQLLTAGVWPRRKEAAPGRTLCQLIVQRVGRARGDGEGHRHGEPRQNPHSFGILARASGESELIQFELVPEMRENIQIFVFAGQSGKSVLAPRIRGKRSRVSLLWASMVAPSW